MDTAAFIADLRARAFAVYAAGDALYVMPSLRDGSLRIGFDCDESFHWWKPNSQTLAQTLADLDAPADVVRRYLGKSNAPLHTAMGVQDCRGKGEGCVVTVGELEFCTECGWFYETSAVNELAEYLGF